MLVKGIIHKNETSDIYIFLENIARISTRTNSKEQSVQFLDKWVVQNGHLSILEHAFITFFIEAPRFVIDQLTRHRHISWLVESTQRVEFMLSEFEKATFPEREIGQVIYSFYKPLRERRSKRYARKILPLGIPTRAVGSGNLRAWIELIGKRLDKGASSETRQVARQMLNFIEENLPDINWKYIINRIVYKPENLKWEEEE